MDGTGGRQFPGGISWPNSRAGVFEILSRPFILARDFRFQNYAPAVGTAPVGGCLVPTNEWITMHGRLRLHTKHYTRSNFNIPGS